MKGGELELLMQKVIKEIGKDSLTKLLRLLISDTQHQEVLFKMACQIQARYYGIGIKAFLKSRKVDVVHSRHIMIYIFYNDYDFSLYALKKYFGVQRNAWIVSINDNIDDLLVGKCQDIPQEYQRISTSIQKLSEVLQ